MQQWEGWVPWLGLLVLGVQGVFAWGLWSLRRPFAQADAVQGLQRRHERARHDAEARLVRLEERFAALEGRQAPDAEALGALSGAVQAVRGDIKALDARISGMDRLMARLERMLDHHAVVWQGMGVPLEGRS